MIEHVRPTARLPGVQGQFGPRLVTYTTQLPPASVEVILGHDPRSKHWKYLSSEIEYIYEKLQRATNSKRLDSIMRYIRYRFVERAIIPGAFPAISIAVQNSTPFTPFDGVPDAGVGVLEFDLSRRNTRILVDGLGRVTASLELVELAESNIPQAAKLQLQTILNEFSLPTVFYMPAPGTPPLRIEEMQQLFHDFNFKATAVTARHAMALDHSDLYIGVTNRIGESQVIVDHGGMEFKASSLGKKSTAIVVQQNLLRFVRGATEGERFLESTTNSDLEKPRLTDEKAAEFEDTMISFIAEFAESMGRERFMDRESLHLTSPGWGTLGLIYHDLAVRLQVPDLNASARALGKIDWRRDNPLWTEIVRQKADKAGNIYLGLAAGGAQNRRFMTQTLRKELGIDRRLKELGYKEDENTEDLFTATVGADEEDVLT